MKKNTKKLTLNRETLHNLAQVAGGYTEYTEYNLCGSYTYCTSGCGYICGSASNCDASFCICQ